jgi:riboflavin kinase/FMN adenylyltransferase
MSDSLRHTTAVYRSLAEIPTGFGPSVAAIGNFDGVHLGHREILSAVVAEARAFGTKAVAVTFDPHPDQFLRPERAPKLLTPLDERLRLLAAVGIDAVVVLRFDAELAQLSALEFVRRVLVESLNVCGLHEGGNFRFGHRAEAGVKELGEFGEEFGFAVRVHEAVRVHGMEVSSSAIREMVSAGDMKRARWMLGRPFGVLSTPARGRGVGTRLLVPTVNLAAYDGLLPGFGVYVTRLTFAAQRHGLVAGEPGVSPRRHAPVAGDPDVSPRRHGPVAGDPGVSGRCFEAVTNVGNRPTFEGAGFGVETHILDFEEAEVGEDTLVQLEFLLRLRGEMKWPSLEALKAQIFKDVARAKRYFRLAGGAAEVGSSE